MTCGMCNTLPLHLSPHHIIPPHFTLHHQTPCHIPRHTIIPPRITYFISHQHLSQHTGYSTLQYISATVMHHATSRIASHFTFYIMPHSMYSTPHFRPHHILATLCIAPPYLTQHSTASCITAFHLTVTTPKSTSHYHVSHNVPHITHQYTTF